MPTAALHTLGCKVNQYETQQISDELAAYGFHIVRFSDKADVYIINTCTVTHTADAKSRHAVRAAAKRNPDAVVVITGCYAETSPDVAASIEGVSLVVGNHDKALIAQKVISLLPEPNLEDSGDPADEHPVSRTRALIKIQDGCNQFCSYCAVPLARPFMWSKPVDDVLTEAGKLADQRYREIVLTGIRTGLYSHESCNLTSLIQKMSDIEGLERIRISSIETTDVPDGLLELMASNPKVCRHLHIPLQSGDDLVLKRMNRPYNSSEFIRFTEKAREIVPEIGITTDIMVGFPGETAEEFENTCRVAESICFSRAHIFRYSARPGTAASELPDVVSNAEKEHRSAELMGITCKSAETFANSLIGTTTQILVEGKEYDRNTYSGLTDNYVRIFVDAKPELVGSIINVEISRSSNGRLMGYII
ncbi:MAG: tRNA (N(6)-L-threonylcarbamoyladenosine(37)-C(2))-methylthiotransferase MtaB [Armatimonadota bacterium]